MQDLPKELFDVYALDLPRGHNFGNRPPVGAWRSDDELACGVVTRDIGDQDFGVLVMRRRIDQVWTLTAQQHGIKTLADAHNTLAPLLKEGMAPEPMPASTAPRLALYDLKGRKPSEVFGILTQPSHHIAAWLLNQLYLALPNPDKNWVSDCQTKNFHTRLWEAQLLASLREQGLLVTQPYVSPDFRIENGDGEEAWIEAVTANPPVPYNHVNSPPSLPPESREERFLGPAALRFAKTLGSKLQRRYDRLSHVTGKPFIIALADFQAPASMLWSREALIGYLYGIQAKVVSVDGRQVASIVNEPYLMGPTTFPAGLFRNEIHKELSAVIFTNACSIAKFNRVGVSAGAQTKGLKYYRIGEFFDRNPNALEGIPFCLEITSREYRSLWPQGYEPWSAELEVFHNPHAQYPVSRDVLPGATHWYDVNDEVECEAFYETSVLWSQTRIQKASDPAPRLEDFLMKPDVPAI